MSKLTLTFDIPEEQEEANMALRGAAYSSALSKFDDMLRARLKWDSWQYEQLNVAEKEGIYSLLEELRSVLNSFIEGAKE